MGGLTDLRTGWQLPNVLVLNEFGAVVVVERYTLASKETTVPVSSCLGCHPLSYQDLWKMS